MTNSSNQDYYYNGNSKLSSKHSPVAQSKAAESKVVKCEDTVTESKATQSKYTEPKVVQYTTSNSTAACSVMYSYVCMHVYIIIMYVCI